jgi:hypothetical protein
VLKNEKKISHAPSVNQPNHNWQTYRTRFTIRARTLSAPLSFIDGLGREQSGNTGDYLVESNGVVTITPRRIFEDVYVAMEADQARPEIAALDRREENSILPPRKSPISTKKSGFFPASRRRSL